MQWWGIYEACSASSHYKLAPHIGPLAEIVCGQFRHVDGAGQVDINGLHVRRQQLAGSVKLIGQEVFVRNTVVRQDCVDDAELGVRGLE